MVVMNKIEYEKFTLDNGLTVIVHEDKKVPMVAVNVWYHVGSKNEKPGKSGFAHLFEHLMFEGSKHHNYNFTQPLEEVGGNDNGSTSTDRTNYWTNVPSDQLELALWLESDRMGFMLDVVTPELVPAALTITDDNSVDAITFVIPIPVLKSVI